MQMMPDCTCSGTTVFLVGNHFSVHDTRVIAGGVCVPRTAITLISRQVMQVTIPWNANTVSIDNNTWVDVHAATPYGVTGHLHIPVISAPADSTLTQVSSPVSPLLVNLDPAAQQLSVKFTHDADFTVVDLANGPPKTVTMKCVDQSVCDAKEKGYDTVLAVVNYASGRSKHATLTNDGTESDQWPLEVNAENLWTEIKKDVFTAHADVYGALETLYAADPTNVSLKVDLYLRGDGVPDLHVIGQLVLKFVEQKGKGPGGTSGILPPPRQNRPWAAAADEFEHRYQPQGQVESGIRLMPAQPVGPPAPAPAQMNPPLRRLPPPGQRGYLRQTPPATMADRQTPRHPSADARALPPYGPGNVPARR